MYGGISAFTCVVELGLMSASCHCLDCETPERRRGGGVAHRHGVVESIGNCSSGISETAGMSADCLPSLRMQE